MFLTIRAKLDDCRFWRTSKCKTPECIAGMREVYFNQRGIWLPPGSITWYSLQPIEMDVISILNTNKDH